MLKKANYMIISVVKYLSILYIFIVLQIYNIYIYQNNYFLYIMNKSLLNCRLAIFGRFCYLCKLKLQ